MMSADPVPVGQWGGEYLRAVASDGSLAYACVGQSLVIVDLSDLTRPRQIGGAMLPDSPYGVTVVGSYAYVADYHSGLQVVDVSNPANPHRVGGWDTPGTAYDVAVAGEYAYVADAEGGLQIFSISTPSSPV
jgi:hypothetical protein